MVIDLEQYRLAKRRNTSAAAVNVRRYDEERLCVNWRPTSGLAATFCYRDPHLMSPALPDNLDGIDVEDFIDRLSALASQI